MIPVEYVADEQKALSEKLEKDPQYSLDPDPEGKLGLSDEQCEFIRAYIQFRNTTIAAASAKIEDDVADGYYRDPVIQGEIRRINLSMYKRQFSRRLLTIDEIGGYLTSMIIGEDVPEIDKLSGKEKLVAVKMMIDLNNMKASTFKDPKVIEYVDLEKKVKGMDVGSIKKLIEETKKMDPAQAKAIDDQKSALIAQISGGAHLDASEIAYLHTCSMDELKKVIEEQEKKKENNQK